MPRSATSPMAIAMPASDMMLASIWNHFMPMNDINTAMGNVTATTITAPGEILDCVRDVLEALRFPRPQGHFGQVIYRFTMRP